MEEELSKLSLHSLLENLAQSAIDFKLGDSEGYSRSAKYFFEVKDRFKQLKEENEVLKVEKQELEKQYVQRMNDCIRLKTQLSNQRKFKTL